MLQDDAAFNCHTQLASPVGWIKLLRQVLGVKRLPKMSKVQQQAYAASSAMMLPCHQHRCARSAPKRVPFNLGLTTISIRKLVEIKSDLS